MSKTRKRVLSALAILFAAALVFTACLALTGCGDSDGDSTGTTSTVTGTKYTIEEAGRYEVGTWVVRYDADYVAEYNGAEARMSLTGDVYMWVIEGGDLFFSNQSSYDSWITGSGAMGSTGKWTNTDGQLAFYINDDPIDMTTNSDGTLTIVAESSNYGTFTVTVNPSDIIGD